MMNIILSILLIILFLSVIYKWKKFGSKWIYKIIFLGISFVILTGFIAFYGKNIDFKTFDGMNNATRIYFSWLKNTGSEISKITSYVINQGWKK